MQWIDTSGTYPTMHSLLPRQTLERYRQLMFELGFYPESGSVAGFGTKSRPALGTTQLTYREILDRELDLEFRREILKTLGRNDADPSELQLATDSPGVFQAADGGPVPNSRDPQSLKEVSKRFIQHQGWQKMLDIADVKQNWVDYVGPEVGLHTQVESFRKGVLVIRTDSTAWATQLKWLLPNLEKRLAQHLGRGVITQVIIRGPQAPSWKHGRLSVPGRGPRDTYG